MTFDSVPELHKVATIFPDAHLVLRIRSDDPEADVSLGDKYGADPRHAGKLLEAATSLGLSVVGVAFHVGSGCNNPAAYRAAIVAAHAVFLQGRVLGHPMHLLDIGGGFAGTFDEQQGGRVCGLEGAAVICAALQEFFPPGCGVDVISEPGRYFARASASLFVQVFGARVQEAHTPVMETVVNEVVLVHQESSRPPQQLELAAGLPTADAWDVCAAGVEAIEVDQVHSLIQEDQVHLQSSQSLAGHQAMECEGDSGATAVVGPTAAVAPTAVLRREYW